MGRVRRCTRRLEFDAAHRVMRHESKCKNLHGHRYLADVTCEAEALDALGRVIDFSIIKLVIGGFIDKEWDHGVILNEEDRELAKLCTENSWRLYTLPENPTAEVLAEHLFHKAALLIPEGVKVVGVRMYETPLCWADYP